MLRKALAVAATLAAGGALGTGGAIGTAHADMVPTPDGIAVKQSEIRTPSRGMTMDQVASKFGAPVTKVPAVGKPPISRWEYPGFVVYFESDHVIHSVVAESSPPAPAAPAASAASTPARTSG